MVLWTGLQHCYDRPATKEDGKQQKTQRLQQSVKNFKIVVVCADLQARVITTHRKTKKLLAVYIFTAYYPVMYSFLLVFAFTLWRCLTVPNDQVFFGKNFADRLQGRFFFTTFPWTNIEEQPTFKAWVSLLCRKGTWALFFSARAMTVCSRKLRDLLMYMASRWSWPSDYNTSSKHSIEAVSSNINAAKFRSAFFAQRR